MGLARAHAMALVGVQGHPVAIEADIENGMVALLLVGLLAAAAAAAGFGAVVVAAENAAEAALVPELRVIAAPSLAAFTAWIRNGQSAADPVMQVLEPGRDIGAAFDVVSEAAPGSRVAKAIATATEIAVVKDLADLVGQPVARRAAEICAAGGHHLMLLGPPGVGKTMLDFTH
jgi:magnesium chelatase family protein